MQLQEKRILLLSLLLTLCWRVDSQLTPTDIVVAQDGSGNFTRVTDAILAAPNYSSRRYYIRIRQGVYAENIIIQKEKTNLALIGEGMDMTIIRGNRSTGGGFTTYNTSTVAVHGKGLIAQGITFENAAGAHMNQAVAIITQADYLAFFKCRFKGYQDTLYAKKGIQFFRECEIQGTVDFIFGDATVVFQTCIIYADRPLQWQSNTITAQGRKEPNSRSGTVIQNCTITATKELREQNPRAKTYLGRPWMMFSRTVIMQSFLDDIIDPQGWLEWEGHKLDKPYYAEYNNRGPGANVDGRVKWIMAINSSTAAAQFTVRNFIQGNTWIPSTRIPFFPDFL